MGYLSGNFKKTMIDEIKKVLGIQIKGSDIRGEIQKCISSFNHPLKVLEFCTGAGKTRTALLEMSGKNCLIVCSQLLHEQNWQEEVLDCNKKFGDNIDDSKFVYVNYKSLKKYIGTSWDIVVYDEGQHITDLVCSYADQIQQKVILILSATLPKVVKNRIKGFGTPKYFTINLSNGIRWGMVPEPEIVILSCPLLNIDKWVFYKGKNKKKKTIDITYQQFLNTYKFMSGSQMPNLKIHCCSKEYYDLLEWEYQRNEYWINSTHSPVAYNMRKVLGNKRKTWMAEFKMYYLKRLIKALDKERKVIFVNYKDQADLLDKNAIHSGKKKKENQDIVDLFNEKKINTLVAVRQLNESMNLTDPKNSLILQLDGADISGVSVSSVQRTGRGLRSALPRIFIFHIPFTRDDDYLKNFRNNLSDKLFTVKKIQDYE